MVVAQSLPQKNSHEITAISTRYVMALNQSGASLGGSDISLYLTSYFNVTNRNSLLPLPTQH